MSGLPPGIFQAFLNYLFSAGTDISVPSEFHEQCGVINNISKNDISGVINTVLDYSVNSASDTSYKIECSKQNLEELLNLWLSKINLKVKGLPTGIASLARDYFRERWHDSSMCVLRMKDWKKITYKGITIEVPQTIWFVNGSSVYVKGVDKKNYIPGKETYSLDVDGKIKIPKDEMVIQKPFNRIFDPYATPYKIRKGIYKNWLAMRVLQEKGDEVITKIIPYIFAFLKGSDKVNYKQPELQEFLDAVKKKVKKYKKEKAKTPFLAMPHDTSYEHVIPEIEKIIKEELYNQGYRAILSGLGFVSIVQGIGDSRKQEVINPKPFIAEVNAGVAGFKDMLMQIIYKIVEHNKKKHKKLFSDYTYLKIVSAPLKINVDLMLNELRSAYVYGTITVRTYQEMLGIDPEQELERMKKEWDDGLREIYQPHLIQNLEKYEDIKPGPTKTTKKQEEKKKEKETKPEHMQEKSEVELESAPYTLKNLPKAVKKYSKKAQKIWKEAFNSALKQGKGEDYAFKVAWSALQKYTNKEKK